MSRILLIICFFLSLNSLQATHLKGTVYEANGEVLPFASVYIQGTSTGTTTNIEGKFSLELAAGTHVVVFQYVGYQKELDTILIQEQDVEVEVYLQPIDLKIDEVVVIAGEDPAYEIIRNAIKKRKYHLNQVEEYRCDAYMKGVQRVENLPEKILGQSLGRFRQGLDSSGNGIVYLSESVSQLSFSGKEYKEVMISSKVSGDDNGFSFNSGVTLSEFNFYKNQLLLSDTRLLSPIAQAALLSYKYELKATFFDEGRMIYKIKVIPKNKLGQLFHGYIYIVDGEWCIHSTELKTTGKAANISMLDTIEFRQLQLPVQDSIWRLFSQEVEFGIKVFGINIFGRFTGVFRNYEINPSIDAKYFNAEVFKVNDDANQRDEQYWDSIRPVPLTSEEQSEYVLKDSLQKIWESPTYMDSLDRLSNRPQWADLLAGYTFNKRRKRWRINLPSPITTIQFNTVQGGYGHLEATFSKGFDEDWTSWTDFHGELEYGLADQQLRGFLRWRYKFNDINDERIELEVGRRTAQYNGLQPVLPLINSLYSLLVRRNFMKLYEKRYAQFKYSRRIMNGLYFFGVLSYEQRLPLVNNSDYSFFLRDQRAYYSNIPTDYNTPPLPDIPDFTTHEQWTIDLYLRIRPGQKYITYPGRRFHMGSKWPDFWLNYRKALPFLTGDNDYDYLSLTIQQDEQSLGSLGLLTWRLKYAHFLNRNQLRFMDYAHFLGNQTIYAKSGMHWRSYQLLPYYEFSTSRWFGAVHVHHDFNGFLWNKLPLLKQLGFEVVAGYHFLYTPEGGDYMELTMGLDRLGWKLLRFGRIDFVTSWRTGQAPKFGVVFGIDFSL